MTLGLLSPSTLLQILFILKAKNLDSFIKLNIFVAAIFKFVAAILDLPSWIRHLGFAILDPPSWIRHLGSAILDLPSWIHHLGSNILHLPP